MHEFQRGKDSLKESRMMEKTNKIDAMFVGFPQMNM
jgi:hypothetical protein